MTPRASGAATVLGIDLGTGSVRAGLYTQGGALLAAREESVTTAHPRPGWAEQSPAQVLDALYRAAAAVAAVAAMAGPDSASDPRGGHVQSHVFEHQRITAPREDRVDKPGSKRFR